MRRVLMTVLLAALPTLAAAEAPPQPVLKLAEEKLRAIGFDTGPTDGIWDDRSAAALAAYQRDWGLTVTHFPDSDILRRLRREHPETKPQWFLTVEGCKIWNSAPYPRETATWSGPCPNGRANGNGVLIWRFTRGGERVEQVYDGTLVEGDEDGQGLMIDGMGGRYEGGWRQGEMHGRGRLVLRDGGTYDGTFDDGRLHGQGVLTLPGGARYEGDWYDNLPHGEGTLRLGDGSVVSGQWINGCYRFEDGKVIALATTPEQCNQAW